MTIAVMEKNNKDLLSGKISPSQYYERIIDSKVKNEYISKVIRDSNRLIKKLNKNK